MDKAHSRFLSLIANRVGFNWNDSEKTTKDVSAQRTVECDLYLRFGSPVTLSDLFRDCAEVARPIRTSDDWQGTTIYPGDVVLCEVAETPQSLRGKLWQLERAMRFGPRHPHASRVLRFPERRRATV